MADGQTGLIKSPITITEASDNVTLAGSDLTTAVEGTMWTYDVPLGTAIEITPVNFFHIVWKDTADNDVGSVGTTRILKANQNTTEQREIWAGPNSLFTGNVYDEFQRPKFRVAVLFNASQKILINTKVTVVGGVDKDNSSFSLEAMQFYEEV